MVLSPYRGDLPEQLRASALSVALSGLLFLGATLVLEGALLWEDPLAVGGFYGAACLSLLASAFHHHLRFVQAVRKGRYVRTAALDALLVAFMVASVARPEALAVAGTLRTIYALFSVFRATGLGRRLLDSLFRRPALATLLSFAGSIAAGTLLLTLPRATTDRLGAAPVDALFTAASANCITGLTVLNTNLDAFANPGLQSFSTFGQVVILLLVQVGALGIMTLSLAGALAMGGSRVTVKGRTMAAQILDEESPVSASWALGAVVLTTLAFEAAGAIVLTVRFLDLFPGAPAQAAWYGVFHSVSAFANAGFSLFSRSLVDFRTDPVLNLTVAFLVVAGGLGFPVLVALGSRRTWSGGVRWAFRRLPLHARVVLVTTGALILGGAAALLVVDAEGGMLGMTWGDRLWASFFQSVSARTAGFNTIDLAYSTRAAVLVYLFLMFVGASPGGTGGGIKTTTLALLLLSLRATLRGRAEVEVFGRSIPHRTLNKVSTVTLLSFGACFLSATALVATQAHLPTEALLFETVSAFGTVGLSMGATPLLDDTGKVLVTFLMYLGRVGPLTLALAVGQGTPLPVRYPEGRITVG